jgi:hypothetical protein
MFRWAFNANLNISSAVRVVHNVGGFVAGGWNVDLSNFSVAVEILGPGAVRANRAGDNWFYASLNADFD